LWKRKIKIHPQKYFKYPWGDCIIFCCVWPIQIRPLATSSLSVPSLSSRVTNGKSNLSAPLITLSQPKAPSCLYFFCCTAPYLSAVGTYIYSNPFFPPL
jgi:hypothetical protein